MSKFCFEVRFGSLPVFAALTMVLSACAAPGSHETEIATPQLRGQAIAESLCAGCHATGRTGASPHPEALPFRRISSHYPVRSLEEALGEGILVGHPDMPPFQLEPTQIDELLSYIEAIQDPV